MFRSNQRPFSGSYLTMTHDPGGATISVLKLPSELAFVKAA
jgi:hypothetical protein